MFVALFALLLQPSVPPAPPLPPPIITSTIVPSPIIGQSVRSQEPPILVAVRATAGGRVLFADEMRVDSMMGANYSQNRSEASVQLCTGPERYDRQQSTLFNLRLNLRPSESGRRLMSVSVNWTRPIDGANCLTSGSRGASINQTVMIGAGTPVVLTGDGGLRIELSTR